MKAIKIRVPIYRNGIFHKFNYHEPYSDKDGYCLGRFLFTLNDTYEIKQPELFTGLTDTKNNLDLYENDIVMDKHTSVGKIIWSENDLSFKFDTTIEDGWQHPLQSGFDRDSLVSISNIHELKGENQSHEQ